MTDHAAFAEWDAAYVLGALTPSDRRAFEAHLQECERCQTAVAELASLPGLLTRARPAVESDADAAPAPPADLVEAITRRRRERTSRIRARILLGAAAAIAAVSLAVAIPVIAARPPAPVATVALAAVGDSTMTATVGLTPVAWGTRIRMECDYPAGDSWGDDGGTWSYVLVVTDDDGGTSEVGSWSAVPGKTITVDAATAVPLDRIASLEVRSASGDPVLAGSPAPSAASS